jgi:hypothetical protein
MNFFSPVSAPWLTRALSWFHQFWTNDENEELEQEVTESMQRIQGLYAAAQEGVQQNEKVLRPSISLCSY